MNAPSTGAEAFGWLAYVALIVLLAAAHRLYRFAIARAMLRRLERPLPGRTRDVAPVVEIDPDTGEIFGTHEWLVAPGRTCARRVT